MEPETESATGPEGTDAQGASRSGTLLFWLLLVAFVGYGLLFIERTSFEISGDRIFCLFDDAMISMTYARNLAAGDGLVWYPGGERVEGFSNPLWVVLMALIHLLPLEAEKICGVVQGIALVGLFVNLLFLDRLGRLLTPGTRAVSLVAVALTAFYLPLNNWSLQGMEVAALTPAVTFAAWRLLLAIRERRPLSTGLLVFLGVLTLVRIDMAVVGVTVVGLAALFTPEVRWATLIRGGVVLATFLILQTAARYAYYGEILPNTYYLKMTGFPPGLRILRGAAVFLDVLWSMTPVIAVLPLVALVFRRDRAVVSLLLLFLAQASYGVYVGGDAWEHWGGSNRFLAGVMPLFFLLVALALVRIVDQVFRGRRGAAHAGFLCVAVVVLSIQLNAIHGYEALRQWTLRDPTLHVEDNRTLYVFSKQVRRLTHPEATIGVAWAGLIPYFSERPCIDLLGKNDKHVARVPMRGLDGKTGYEAFYPGHMKRDFEYSITGLKPDIIATTWPAPAEAQPHLGDYVRLNLGGNEILVRQRSPRVRWEVVR